MTLLDNILHNYLPKEILCHIFSEYLSFQDISRLDVAICSHEKRPGYLDCIGSASCIWPGDKQRPVSSEGMSWLNNRNIKIRHLNCGAVTDDTALIIAGFGIHLQWLKSTIY
jgi:hypothetical protein